MLLAIGRTHALDTLQTGVGSCVERAAAHPAGAVSVCMLATASAAASREAELCGRRGGRALARDSRARCDGLLPGDRSITHQGRISTCRPTYG